MQGPVAHLALVIDDISFRNVMRIEPPGIARITGGSSLPSNEKSGTPGHRIAYRGQPDRRMRYWRIRHGLGTSHQDQQQKQGNTGESRSPRR
jgi:hypothetical protein